MAGGGQRPPPLWLCSYVAMWLYGCVAMWLRGYVATWLRGYVAKWLSRLQKRDQICPTLPYDVPAHVFSMLKVLRLLDARVFRLPVFRNGWVGALRFAFGFLFSKMSLFRNRDAQFRRYFLSEAKKEPTLESMPRQWETTFHNFRIGSFAVREP